MNNYTEILTDEYYSLFDNDIEIAKVEFVKNNNSLKITKTIVNPSYQGKGLAKILMNKCQEIAESENLKIQTSCSYAIKYFNL